MDYNDRMQIVLQKADSRLMQKDPQAYEIYSMIVNNDQTCGRAYLGLGHCYLNGIGCERDVNRARYCYDKAFGLGENGAYEYLEECNAIIRQSSPAKADTVGQDEYSLSEETINSETETVPIVISLVLAVFLMTAPFLKTISFAGESGSFWELIKSLRSLLRWVYKDNSEALRAMLEDGGSSAYVAGSYIVAIILYFALAIELLVSVIRLAISNIRSFWKSIRGFADGMLIIEAIAFSWIAIINSEGDFAGIHMKFTGLFWAYVISAVILLVIAFPDRSDYPEESETEEVVYYKTCPMCGATFQPSSRFCTKCGSMLESKIDKTD